MHLARQLGSQSGLADPGLADHRDQLAAAGARSLPALAQPRELGVAPDERSAQRRRRARAAAPHDGSCSSEASWRRIDSCRSPQLRAGLDADLLHQQAARVAVGLERLGLAPAAIQREHAAARPAARAAGARPPAPAARRPASPCRPAARSASTRSLESRPVAAPRAARISAARTARTRDPASGGPRHSPSASRSSDAACSGCSVGERPPACVDQLVEALGVELARSARAGGSPRAWSPRSSPSPSALRRREMCTCTVLIAPARRVVAPQRDGQALSAHRLVGVQQQHRQQRPRPRAPQGHSAAGLGGDLKWTQDPEMHMPPRPTLLRQHTGSQASGRALRSARADTAAQRTGRLCRGAPFQVRASRAVRRPTLADRWQQAWRRAHMADR